LGTLSISREGTSVGWSFKCSGTHTYQLYIQFYIHITGGHQTLKELEVLGPADVKGSKNLSNLKTGNGDGLELLQSSY
jgi:hypothetical protein